MDPIRHQRPPIYPKNQRCSSLLLQVFCLVFFFFPNQHVGCITAHIRDSTYLTVPVYASICSAMCYEPPHALARIKKCPFSGEKDLTPELSYLYNR